MDLKVSKNSNNTDFNKDIPLVDILKAVTIFLVVFGHCIQRSYLNEDFFENIVFKTIYTFHMPLFMSISGYLFYVSCIKHDITYMIKRVLRTVLWPLLMWAMITGIFDILMGEQFASFGAFLYYEIGNIWYLVSLFVNSIILILFYYFFSNKKYGWIFILLGGFLIRLCSGIIEPYSGINLWMYPYFLAGFFFSKHFEKIKRFLYNRYVFLITFVALIACVFFFKKRDYIYTSGLYLFDSEYGVWKQLAIDVFRWLAGFLGIIVILFLLKKIEPLIKGKPSRVISFIGRNTLQIYLLQRIIIERIASKMYIALFDTSLWGLNSELLGLLMCFLAALVLFTLLSLLAWLISKWHWGNLILFGKKVRRGAC